MDIKSRKPVWEALSTLFLDTDVSLDRQYRSKILASSKFSLDELDKILKNEVYPVCAINFIDPAGVWEGFNPDWLEEEILKKISKKTLIPPFIPNLKIGYDFFIKSEWEETKKVILNIR